MGLMSFKDGDYKAAEKYFLSMLDLEQINTNRKVEAAFWAGRSAEMAGKLKVAKNHWRIAMQRPASFYGSLAAVMSGKKPKYEFYETQLSRGDIDELKRTAYGLRALALLQIKQNDLAENQIRYLITDRASDDLLHAVHSLTSTQEMPRAALAVAPVIKERGILEIDSNVILSAQFPVPEWEPRGGWNIDRAMLFAVARQESRFKTNAKSHAGAKGLLQLMPKTAKITAKKAGSDIKKLDLTTAEDSMFLGQQHMQYLFALDNVNRDIIRMLISYNAGNGNQNKFEKRFQTSDPLLYIESFHLAETRDYVKKVMSNLWLYRAKLDQSSTTLYELADGKFPKYEAEDDYATASKTDSKL